MPDISKCNAVKHRSICKQKENCYRFMCEPNSERQSYFSTAPFAIMPDGSTECEYFWEIKDGEDERNTDSK